MEDYIGDIGSQSQRRSSTTPKARSTMYIQYLITVYKEFLPTIFKISIYFHTRTLIDD